MPIHFVICSLLRPYDQHDGRSIKGSVIGWLALIGRWGGRADGPISVLFITGKGAHLASEQSVENNLRPKPIFHLA